MPCSRKTPAFGGYPEHSLAVAKEVIHPFPVALAALSWPCEGKSGAVPGHVDHARGRAYPHAAVRVGIEGGHLGLARWMGDRDRGERSAGIAFQALTAADPKGRRERWPRSNATVSTSLPLSRCKARRGVAGRVSRAKTPLLPPSQSVPCASSARAVAIQRARGLGLRDGHKAFPIEKCRPGRGDGPDPVAAVLIAEPNRICGQALGGGVRGKGAAAVAQQAGGGADPQSAGSILKQVGDGIALELRCVLGIEGDKVDAIEAHQASIGAQPQIAVAGLQDGVDGVLRQTGIGAPGLVAVVVERLVADRAPARRD